MGEIIASQQIWEEFIIKDRFDIDCCLRLFGLPQSPGMVNRIRVKGLSQQSGCMLPKMEHAIDSLSEEGISSTDLVSIGLAFPVW